MAFVRSSKYRHVYGTAFKRDNCYDGIRITKAPHDSNMCSVNGKFLAVVLEAQGGGAFLVAPLSAVSVHDRTYRCQLNSGVFWGLTSIMTMCIWPDRGS